MGETALVAWVVTAAAGLLLYAVWAARGGLRQQPEDVESASAATSGEPARVSDRPVTALPMWQATTHGLMALVGLGFWIVYLDRSDDPRAQFGAAPWLTVGLLVFIAGLGLSMFRNWQTGRRARRGRTGERPADQHLPALVVYVHGLAALVTIVLVVLVALEVD